MFLCYIASSISTLFKSLPKNANNQMSKKNDKETSLCARRSGTKGSLTLEAAIVFPLCIFFLATFLFFFQILSIETKVYVALNYASRQTAAMGNLAENNTASLAMANALFLHRIAEEDNVTRYLPAAKRTLMLATSEVSDEYVDLIADYRVALPVTFFKKDIHIRQEVKSRKWMGSVTETEDSEKYVYVTEFGSVYHLTKNCSYLNLSIQTADSAEIEGLRNVSGHKYYACERCVAKNIDQNMLYITDYGDAYHTSLECGGLKRTLSVVKMSEVADKKGCSKCAKSQ